MADNDPSVPNPVAPGGGQPPSTARLVIGTLLLVIGMVLTGGAGLCTGVLSLVFLFDSGGGPELSGDDLWMLPLIFGGPFVIVGALMWWGGAAIRGKRRPSAPPPPWVQPPPPQT
jgi:hypothetical protein